VAFGRGVPVFVLEWWSKETIGSQLTRSRARWASGRSAAAAARVGVTRSNGCRPRPKRDKPGQRGRDCLVRTGCRV
jgi:hypothetical protein